MRSKQAAIIISHSAFWSRHSAFVVCSKFKGNLCDLLAFTGLKPLRFPSLPSSLFPFQSLRYSPSPSPFFLAPFIFSLIQRRLKTNFFQKSHKVFWRNDLRLHHQLIALSFSVYLFVIRPKTACEFCLISDSALLKNLIKMATEPFLFNFPLLTLMLFMLFHFFIPAICTGFSLFQTGRCTDIDRGDLNDNQRMMLAKVNSFLCYLGLFN